MPIKLSPYTGTHVHERNSFYMKRSTHRLTLPGAVNQRERHVWWWPHPLDVVLQRDGGVVQVPRALDAQHHAAVHGHAEAVHAEDALPTQIRTTKDTPRHTDRDGRGGSALRQGAEAIQKRSADIGTKPSSPTRRPTLCRLSPYLDDPALGVEQPP